jgi:hypothetical protein
MASKPRKRRQRKLEPTTKRAFALIEETLDAWNTEGPLSTRRLVVSSLRAAGLGKLMVIGSVQDRNGRAAH